MGTDNKTTVQQPSSKVSVVSSSSSSKNIKKKKSKSSHHKSKHSKQTRSESSSSRSSNDYDRNTTASSKKSNKNKNSKDKNKLSSSNDTRSNEKKSSSSKKKTHRSKHDSSESPHKRNLSRSRSRSRSRSDRSSNRSSSHESQTRYRYKNSMRRSNANMQNVYAPISHSNFSGNMPRHYAPQARGGRMPPYMAPGIMGGPPIRNNNGNRRSGGNSPPQSLLGGYRPPVGNFRGRGGPMANPAYIHNMANVLNLIQQQQQKQKPGSHKYANPNNPNNRFFQQFQDNYKKISQGQKVSNLYQASFPVQHIPREMRFNFRLLGRNIFTASDEEEEQQQQQQKQATSSDKRSKQRRDSSSSSDSRSDDDRRKRRDDNDDDDDDDDDDDGGGGGGGDKPSKSKSSPSNKTDQKRSSNKNNRNRTSSATTGQHPKGGASAHELLTDPANLGTLLAGIMQSDNPEAIANTLATAAAVVNSKRERTKKQLEKKVQKFKNYARFQQIKAAAGGVVPQTNPEDVEKKIHGLARRLQMKTIGLHDDYESQGIKRSDESSGDSDGNARRRRSSGSSSERSKDKDAGSDASGGSQRRKLKKLSKRTNKKMNSTGQLIGSSDSEQHRSDGNDSDGSMLDLNEDLKPISYYIKDRERMLHEMFRCVRGIKLQAILPDALKTRSLDEIKAKCLDQLDILSKKRIRAILSAQPMTSSSGTEDSTDEDEQDFFTLYPHTKSALDLPNNNGSNSNTSNLPTIDPPADTNKKLLPNSKFRPVQMQAVTENTPAFQSTLAAPVVVGGDDDVRDYYEGFKHIKKLASLRRNEQEDELLPFPDQSGKVFQPIGSNLPKFEFKPITSLTNSQQAHLNARRAAQRQQQQQIDVRQEIDDLLGIDDFILPGGERPISSAQLSSNEQRRYGLPPRLHHKTPVGPPKKGSLGDLLKQKNRQTGDRSPSPIIEETNSKRSRRHRRSRSLSSTGSRQWSRSSSRSTNNERISRHSSREITPNDEKKSINDIDELNDMSDLSKLLDLNEEDELLLLQIEVEQEERNIRREEKRRRKEEKKKKRFNKKFKSISSIIDDHHTIIQQCLNDLMENIHSSIDDIRINSKRTFNNHSDDELTKKIKLEQTN